jgi:hypothetical protein
MVLIEFVRCSLPERSPESKRGASISHLDLPQEVLIPHRNQGHYKRPKMWCEVLHLDTHLLQFEAAQLFRANVQCIEVPAVGLVCQHLDFILAQFCGDCYQPRDEIWLEAIRCAQS